MTAVVSDVNLTESPPPRLWRNRAFNLLWGSQAVSGLGSSMSQLALPLLSLGITGSPIKAGIVGTAAATASLAAQLPAGVITLLTGAFFTWFGGPGTILALAGVIAVSAVVATVSKGMRNMRPLSEMGAPA